jgi:hypothetical protein
MPGSVNKVKLVRRTVGVLVLQRDALRLDGDTALSLEVHRVEHLSFHLSIRQPTTALYKAVGQRRFTVVDMGNDREITNVLVVCHAATAPF